MTTLRNGVSAGLLVCAMSVASAPVLADTYIVAVGAAFDRPGLLVALLASPAAVRPVRTVLGGAQGPALIPVLKDTGLLLLAWGVAVAVGLALG